MAPLKYLKIILLLIIIQSFSCKVDKFSYKGSINLHEHKWLKNRKIFLDPGHGGKGRSDRFRTGPYNITEEEVNLRVGLILGNMLARAGAIVKMSRREDIDISLDERAEMAARFRPELLVSIHHNGSARKDDEVNYPTVFIWGSRHVRPASFDFASYLQEELNEIMDNRGYVLSDFSVYSETGTRILRKTRYLCPGALGEGGFFTDTDHALRLKDIHYNQLEAEAYFKAISKFFKRGIPSAEVLISCPVDNKGKLINGIKDQSPLIAIKIYSGIEKKGIMEDSLNITLDNIPIRWKKLTHELLLLDYGRKLYPGGHSIRFQFKNLRAQNSMVFSVPITVEIKKGDYKRLVLTGRRYIKRKGQIKEGLKMLISAYSMDKTGPQTDKILYDIALGFYYLGEKAQSQYFFNKLYYFYPQSRIALRKGRQIYYNQAYRYMVDYYGKRVKLTGDINIKEHRRNF